MRRRLRGNQLLKKTLFVTLVRLVYLKHDLYKSVFRLVTSSAMHESLSVMGRYRRLDECVNDSRRRTDWLDYVVKVKPVTDSSREPQKTSPGRDQCNQRAV